MVSTKLETFWHPHEIINLVLEKSIENRGLCKSTIYWETWKITQLSSILIMILFGNKTTCRSLFWVALKCIKLWHFFSQLIFLLYQKECFKVYISREHLETTVFSFKICGSLTSKLSQRLSSQKILHSGCKWSMCVTSVGLMNTTKIMFTVLWVNRPFVEVKYK